MKTLTKFIVFSLAMTILYTVIAIVFQAITGNELSSQLTVCFMAVYGGEVLSCALIKVFKLKEGENG